MVKNEAVEVAQWEVPPEQEVGLSSLARGLRQAGLRVTLILELELPDQEDDQVQPRHTRPPQS
jgi:hypothetical protein